VPPDELKSNLAAFVSFAQSLRGDEKSESQSFLDQFFRALGHKSAIEAGAIFEFRVAKKPGSAQIELIQGNGVSPRSKSGKKFADLLWPDRVLIEMKSRGENLEKHYDQAFDYWTHIVPKRPPFVILCNFDEFWVYDFNTQLFDPVDKIKTGELSENISSFNFLLPIWKKPIFGNNWVDVTRRAADQMATVFREIVFRGEARERAQRFILQLLVAMVAEDTGLLPEQLLSELLRECAETGGSSFDLIGGLFRQMASPRKAGGGRYVDVQYFNGGLFEVVDPIELKQAEAYRLCQSAAEDWSKVRPEIFGALFQDSMDKKERHAFGAHFTSEFDIRKVVGPTIVKPWRERIDAAGKNVGELRKVLADLRAYRVLDPACGSGNFLFIAYREMKRLERDILLRLREVSRREPLESAISLHQFFGIDILPFAVELAKVTLMLAKELELIEARKLSDTDQLFIEEKPLPLDNLDKNIVCADALFADWPKADAIIGNPPYLGSRYIAQEHSYEYARKLQAHFPDVPKMADYCTHWFRRAHDALSAGGHAGLVGTNTIRQNEGREASLDYILDNGGVITDAVSTQVWSGDAAVHVSIVNWTKGTTAKPGRLTFQRGDSVDSPWETFELSRINAALSVGVDVGNAVSLTANGKSKTVFVGQYPFNEGFMLDPIEAAEWIKSDPKLGEVIFPYMIGRDLVELGQPSRWIIDFGQNDLFYARSYPRAFERVEERVMPDVVARAEREKAETGKTSTRWTRVAARWWQFRDYQPGTIAAIHNVPRYVAVSRVTKRPIFEFVSSEIHPDNALVIFPLADDYSFGILQSGVHFEWFKARCSTLEGRFRYTSDTVFDSFPWPQNPTRTRIQAVAEAGVTLRSLRREIMEKLDYSLRDLYRTLEQPGENPLREAHVKLDAAVRAAYARPGDADPLAFLLDLNLSLAAKEKAGETITPPGLPLPPSEHAFFITDDCIRVEAL
jgi:SAM-dependent methyltransferase